MKSIKIYWNGFKVNGENELVKVHFTINGKDTQKESISFYGYDYKSLPKGFGFNVHNDSDYMTDYVCNDHGVIFPRHPLYKYVRFAALKSLCHDNRLILKNRYYSDSQKQKAMSEIAEFENLENPGQPTKAELESVLEYIEKAEAEKQRIKREQEEKEREQREFEFMVEKMETEITVRTWTEKFPVIEGHAVVKIPFSEMPGIEKNSVWSLKAADNIFRDLDARKHAKHEGYDKTDFIIEFNDVINDDDINYHGRYDIGDGEGGLLNHIFNFMEWERTHEAFGKVKENPPETTDGIELFRKIERLCDI